jgi:uroporphyrinogen decarboxylase
VKKIALEQIKHKVDAIKISSPYAGAGFISPEFYREFVLPYEQQIALAVRAQDVHIYTHTCGAINDRLEMMIEAGISGLECLDPPPLGDVRLEEAKKQVGARVFIKGNIDPVNMLLFGTEEEVKEDAKYRIDVGKPDGGFILSTACSIAPHTKRENVQILARAAEEVGHY